MTSIRLRSIASSPIFLGLWITLGQVAAAMLLGLSVREKFPDDQRNLGGIYRALAHWDSYWYWNIVERGYYVPEPQTPQDLGNVTFFPGYPIVVGILDRLFGLHGSVTLAISGQIACSVFWTYLILLMRFMRFPPREQGLLIGLLLCHPAAYFLVCGYSESLFLASFLGMCYWGTRTGIGSLLAAAMHGYLMTSTRIVGVPLVVVPLVGAMFSPSPNRRSLMRSATIGLIALTGVVSFFVWCHYRFGKWNIYFLTEEIGWGVRPNYLAPLSGSIYWFHPMALLQTLNAPQPFDRIMVALSVDSLGAMLLAEGYRAWRGDASWRRRIHWYVAAAGLIYVPVAGHFHRDFGSFTRFSLVAWVPLLIAIVDVFGESWRRWSIPILVVCSVGIGYQIHFTENFLLGYWTF